MNRRHTILLAAAASAVATLLVGGITWAAIPGDGGVISACYGKVGGVVRVIDVAKKEKCVSGIEVPFSWNQQGPKGDPGTPGHDGADGDDGVSPSVVQLEANDANCPAGGAAITDVAGHTAYVCSAQPFSGTVTSPSGEYSISVTDQGITLSRGNTVAVSITGQDINIVAERDTNITVGRDLTTTISGALATTVGTNASAAIGGNMTTSIAGSNSTTIGADTTTMVGGNAGRSVAGAVDLSVGGNLTIDVGGNTSIETDQDLSMQTGDDGQILFGGDATVQTVQVLNLRGSAVNIN